MLLGIDFLQGVDATLECGRGTITIRGQTFSLSALRPFADPDKSDFSKQVPVRMVTRIGENTYPSGNAAGTSAQPGTVDIPVVGPEPTAQLFPPEPIEQSWAEALLSSNAVETKQPTSLADPDTGPAPASSGSRHTANANEPTRGSKSANEEGITLSNYVASDFANLQSKDANIAFLREYLLHKTEANKGDLLLASSEAKCYYNERARFELDDDGVIWRKPDARHDPLRLLVPSTERAELLGYVMSFRRQGIKGCNAPESVCAMISIGTD
jgi:hypothetical protein